MAGEGEADRAPAVQRPLQLGGGPGSREGAGEELARPATAVAERVAGERREPRADEEQRAAAGRPWGVAPGHETDKQMAENRYMSWESQAQLLR